MKKSFFTDSVSTILQLVVASYFKGKRLVDIIVTKACS